MLVNMYSGDNHGMVGHTVTGLKPLRLVHVQLEPVGSLLH